MSKQKLYKFVITACLLLLGQVQIEAQVLDTSQNKVEVNLPSEQLEVIKLFQARLEDAKKISVLPESPPERPLESFQYQVNIRPIELDYLEPVIRPISMLSDPKPEKKNGFVRAAYGNLNTINAGLGYNYLSPRETEINLMADFLQMNNKSRIFHQYQNIDVNLGVYHNVGPLLAVAVDADYDRKSLFFFGSDIDSTETDTSKYRRTINKFGFGINFLNGETNVYNFDYEGGLKYQNVSLSNENLQENNFLVSLRAAKGISENLTAGLEAKIDITSILDTASLNYNNYFVKPFVSYGTDKLKLDAGLNFAFDQFKNYYLPDLFLSYSPVDYSIIPYAFWKGELQKNNISHLLSINPFLSKNIIPDLSNTVIQKYGAGIKGAFSTINYDIQVSYGRTDDLILFNSVLNEDEILQFDILKDTANILEIGAGIDYEINEDLSLNSDFKFRNFDLNNNVKAWHLPTYQFDFELRYFLLEKKLLINPKLYLRDGVFVKNADGIEEQLNPLVDFNLNVEYKIKDQLRVYGQVNNVLASEYQRWDNYSQYGLNALVGLKVSF